MTPENAAISFHAMGSGARLTVLRLLVRAGDEGLSVGDIQARTGIAASTLSHHIRILNEAGVIEQSRQGRSTMTRAAYGHLQALADFILDECCRDAGRAPDSHSHERAEA